MATKFLEPGGDADFAKATTNGFWNTVAATVAVSTAVVHGAHIKSLLYDGGISPPAPAVTKNTILADTGSRISLYIYLATLPSSGLTSFLSLKTSGNALVVNLRVSNTGVLQLWDGTTAQIGSSGSTLSTGVWYRISLAYTITDTTHNRFEVFKDGVSDISVTNATITNVGTDRLQIGMIDGAFVAQKMYSSDHYVDDSSALTDPGNIWVTAKRPNANGTTNGFSTQIGSGGSGYGSGHSPQVNERALSTTNGWSMVGAGAAVTEEYNIEGKSVGDINISAATIIDWVGWVSVKSLVAETINMILDGVNFAQAITSTITLYTKIKGSAIFPSGTGVDIGMQTDTSLTTVSLYECGIIVAYIPGSAVVTVKSNPSLLTMGVG